MYTCKPIKVYMFILPHRLTHDFNNLEFPSKALGRTQGTIDASKRAAREAPGSNLFHFHAVFRRKLDK